MTRNHRPTPTDLSADETEQLLLQITDLSTSGLPLGAGLRAAAEEAASARLNATLREVADRVDRGQPFDQALAECGDRLSRHFRGLLAVVSRTGHAGPALTELLEQQRQNQELRRALWSALAYPAFVVALTLAMVSSVQFLELARFSGVREMVAQFEIKVDRLTQAAFRIADAMEWLRTTHLWLVLPSGVLLGVIGVAWLRLALGPARWRGWLGSLPLFGPLWRWSSVSDLTRLLAVLTDHDVPLPEALRLAADGVEDASLQATSRALATRVSEGGTLSALVAAGAALPASLAPLLRWGEQSGTLAEALRTGAEMFAERVRLRAQLLKTVLPPLAFLFVTMAVLIVIGGGVLGPLLAMLQVISHF